MKNKLKKPRFIALRPGAILYFIILVISLIFTQALRSPASAILFIFLLILPIISVIYLVVARAGIKVYTECDNTRVEKGQPVSYLIKIINESPLPFPFVETVVSLPSENAVICRDELMRITLLPMGAHIIDSVVSFPLRGSYDIGVKYMYVGDLFGLFRTEMKLELHRTVIVYPRNIVMGEDSSRSDTDLPTSVVKRAASHEEAELSDIRDYLAGDPLKNIHWKLSSKSEELQVKDFASNTDMHTYILCDLSFTGHKDHVPAAEDKPKKSKKGKKMHRRDKAEQSPAVAAAKSVGDAGGKKASAASGTEQTKERLAALGVTAEHIAALGNTTEDAVDITLGASRRSAKAARDMSAKRFARLAMMIEEANKSGDKTAASPFIEENIPYAGEICADSVVELALSVMRHEVRRGAKCTILYPDSRMINGYGVLSGDNDMPDDPLLLQFFTAPVCRDSEAFARLSLLIEQTAGLTIRIVTANTDVYSAAVFSAVPAAFGGSGSGCSAEVLISSPTGLWKEDNDRSVSAQALGEELARSNVGMRQYVTDTALDGSLRFTSEF